MLSCKQAVANIRKTRTDMHALFSSDDFNSKALFFRQRPDLFSDNLVYWPIKGTT